MAAPDFFCKSALRHERMETQMMKHLLKMSDLSKEEIIESLDEHEKILKALRRKDADLSEELIKLHTITTRDHYIVRLQDVFGERLGE